MFPFLKKKAEAMTLSNSTSQFEAETSPLPKNILPVIQPYDWPGKYKTLNRSLCYLPRIKGTPWLSFAFDAGAGITAFASEGSIKKWGVSAGELELIALQNMRDTPAEWEMTEIDFKEGQPVNALLCQSEGRIAERILDGELLQLAHDHLKEALLVALIPSRTTLIILPLSGDIPFRVANHFYSNSQAALSDWVFCITKAGVAGRVVMENGQFIFDTAIM